MKSACLFTIGITVLAPLSALADQDRCLMIGFEKRQAWQVSADQPWWVLIDLRDMLNIFHPFSIPKTGASAGASRDVTIPADWRPPLALRFYCADDYFADTQPPKPDARGIENFFEHRYKQVLIDDRVIWDRDVADENTIGAPTVFDVDVTPYVQPGKLFRLTLRVIDKVTTERRNERDVWFRSGTWYAPGTGEKEEPPRFHTAIWFADPVIGEQAAVQRAPEGTRPHDAIIKARHSQRWPLAPRAMPLKLPLELTLVTPVTIPATGFPITCGIPMPPGLLKSDRVLRLTNRAGRALPLQCSVGARWPDGAIRHLMLTSIAPPGSKSGDIFRLRTDDEGAPSEKPMLDVKKDGHHVTVDTGRLRLHLGADSSNLIDRIYLENGPSPICSNMTARLTLQDEKGPQPIEARWQSVEIVEHGPLAVRVELNGTLVVGARHVGRFMCRVYAYAGLPTIQTHFRVTNDVEADAPLKISDMALIVAVSGGVRSGTTIGVANEKPIRSDAGLLSLHQLSPDTSTVRIAAHDPVEGKRPEGWIAASGAQGSIQAVLKHFWAESPKGLSTTNDQMELALFKPTDKQPFYTPNYGESKRHDVWFTFSPGPSAPEIEQAFGSLIQSPPRLFDRRWFCLSGGFAVLDPDWFEHQPSIARWVEEQYGDASIARIHGSYGIRDFGDTPYMSDKWMNGYWARIQGALYWGLVSGHAPWIDRSSEIARHIADVDCVRIVPGKADWEAWNGVTCALGKDHSRHDAAVKWPAFQQGESLLLHSWMTGDPDSREAGIANADYILRSRAGVGSSEARSQARPMLTLLRAWQATSDAKYLQGARVYLDLKSQTEHVIDWRRGAYIQPTYANYRCVSAGLDSMYALNIYEYYRLTGDVDAARLVVAIADGIYAESMLPQEEAIGSFLFYVRYSRGAWYYTQMAILFHMAYDLTGDSRFLRAGRAAFERYLRTADGSGKPMYQSFANFGWLDPELGGWQIEFKDVQTGPAPIESETPDPDPANYR